MKMKPETREQYIKGMRMAILSIEAVIAEYKRDQRHLQDANIRAFKEIKEICERQIALKNEKT